MDHPERIEQIAEWLDYNSSGSYRNCAVAASYLRSQRRRIAELEAQLNKMELQLEDWECLGRVMDDEGVPDADETEAIYSPVGRYRNAIKTAKRDGVLEAVEALNSYTIPARGIGVAVDRSQFAYLCADLLSYANTIGE